MAHPVYGSLRAVNPVVDNDDAACRAPGVPEPSQSAEFPDALVTETTFSAGADETMTFDQKEAASSGLRCLRRRHDAGIPSILNPRPEGPASLTWVLAQVMGA
jgi:hypothetical protein